MSINAAEESLPARLRSQLADVKTSNDSLKILFDIYDLTTYDDRRLIGDEIMNIAVRTGQDDVLAEFVPQMAALSRQEESRMKKLLEYANHIDNTDTRKGVKLFVNVMRAVNDVTYTTDEELHDKIIEYAKANLESSGDQFQDVLDLYRLVLYVGRSAKSGLYLEYLDRLDAMIKQLPENCYQIRNLHFTSMANIHTQNGNGAKAIEADKNLIEVIRGLEEKYKKAGRKYRNYDRFYYISYRRMLRNFKSLSLDEVKEYYTKCAMLAEKDEEVRGDFEGECRPTIYRLMAEHQFAEALPKIKHFMKLSEEWGRDHNVRKEMLGLLVAAADSVGDNAALLSALKEYNKDIQEQLVRNSEETYRSLQIRYDINELREANTQLQLEKKDQQLSENQKLIMVALAAVLVFAVFVMTLYRRNFNLRQRSHDLRRENERLHKYMEQLLDDGNPAGSLDIRKRSKAPEKKELTNP